MTFEGQEKPGQHTKQRRKVKTGKDKAKEGWAKLRGGGGVYPTLKGGTSPEPWTPGFASQDASIF